MDFRMDKISWVMIVMIIMTMFYFILQGMGWDAPTSGYFKAFAFALVVSIILIALMSIPVLIYCYFTHKIPDIDYSVRAAFIFTIIGVIYEIITALINGYL